MIARVLCWAFGHRTAGRFGVTFRVGDRVGRFTICARCSRLVEVRT